MATVRALFRFTGPDQSQLVCVDKGDGFAAQRQSEFLAANGGVATAAWLWDRLPHLPAPTDPYPELETALDKVVEYLAAERPVREKIASLKSQGILADEAELLGKITEIQERLVSMYLAKTTKLFMTRHQEPAAVIGAGAEAPDTDATEPADVKGICTAMVATIMDRALPEEVAGPLSSSDVQALAREMIQTVFEPKGRLRERARRDPQKLAEVIGLATLPAIAKGRRQIVASMLMDMLEYTNLVGFEPELSDADNWPRLRARARRGMMVS